MSIEQFIDNEVKSNDVVLFMKGTPQFPQCGFSGQVVQILDHVGVGYKGLNVLESADLRAFLQRNLHGNFVFAERLVGVGVNLVDHRRHNEKGQKKG